LLTVTLTYEALRRVGVRILRALDSAEGGSAERVIAT